LAATLVAAALVVSRVHSSCSGINPNLAKNPSHVVSRHRARDSSRTSLVIQDQGKVLLIVELPIPPVLQFYLLQQQV